MNTPSSTDQKLLPAVIRFLGAQSLNGFIGGTWEAASSGQRFQTIDPGSKQVLAQVESMDSRDVDRAVAAAAAAFPSWSRLTAAARAEWIEKFASAIEADADVLAQLEALDAGKLPANAKGEVLNCVQALRYFNKLALELPRRQVIPVDHFDASRTLHAWGPCAFIVPWNFPILLIGWGVSAALAAGNTVIVKPAEDTPLSALYLGVIAERIGLPAGVFNVVPGFGKNAGAALAGHPGIKRMSFTGSPEVGIAVAQACAKNLVPCKLELGGKGAALIFKDTNVADTASKLVEAITFNSGQVCCDATRWLVQSDIYDDFIDAARSAMKRVHVGYQFKSGTTMGPVVSDKQLARVSRYVSEGLHQGAELLYGNAAGIPDVQQGCYVSPTLLAGRLDNVAARDEIFGPVAYISRFGSEDDGIEKANSSAYGLANSVWSGDLDLAARVSAGMVVGNSWINAHNLFPFGVPYGGVNLSGLGGGVNSPETLMDYLRGMSVVRPH
jgi:acyl-CoA reductase-like NAD-dependent aldehyde dehydrogenase